MTLRSGDTFDPTLIQNSVALTALHLPSLQYIQALDLRLILSYPCKRHKLNYGFVREGMRYGEKGKIKVI